MERPLADDLREHRPEAVDRILVELGVEIQAIAQVILRDRDEAADVLGETVITAWERASRLRGPVELRPWLLGMAADLALRRQRRNERLLTQVRATDQAATPSMTTETRLVILEGLALLAPRERAVVALACLADLPIDEVARVLHIRARTAGVLLDEALAKLEYSMVDDAGPSATIVEIQRV